MEFKRSKQVFDFVRDAERGAEMIRQQLATRMGIDGCYYEGIQWLNQGYRFGYNRSGTSRMNVDWNPESRRLRAVDNRVTFLTQKSAASTHPQEIYMDAVPPDRDTGTDALFRVRVHETVVNTAIEDAGLLPVMQDANARRCIFGTHGIGLAIEDDTRVINGQPVPGRRICAFDFDSSNLVTDPHCQRHQLALHPWVIYTDVWTLDRVKAVLGIEIPESEASTVEQLEPTKMDLNAISNNRLFTRYARFAKTKAVRIYQVHYKSYGYRFDQMYVTIETKDKKQHLVTPGMKFDASTGPSDREGDEAIDTGATQSPFGGCGMPLILLHGYFRADTMWSWGEPAQIKDVQDKANLVETNQQRIIQACANPRYLVDRRWFKGRPNDDDINKVWTNQVGGLVVGDGGDRQQNVAPPQVLPPVMPPAFLMEAMNIYGDQMRDRIHKAPGNFGQTPTHVPFKTTERVLDDADQVSSVRIGRDVMEIERLVADLHSTTLKLIKEQNPPTLASLVRVGCDAQDFSVLVQEDWLYPNIKLKVRASSMRNQSATAKKQNLDAAASMQMIEPDQYQQALADSGMDMPLTEEWRQMQDKCRRIALNVLMGEPFQPRPMGRWNNLLINELIRAQMDRRAQLDPSALPRLVSTINAQYDMAAQEQLMANPELRMKMAQAQQPQAEQGAEQAGPQPGQSVSVADLIGSLSQGGSGAGAPVPASAA